MRSKLQTCGDFAAQACRLVKPTKSTHVLTGNNAFVKAELEGPASGKEREHHGMAETQQGSQLRILAMVDYFRERRVKGVLCVLGQERGSDI